MDGEDVFGNKIIISDPMPMEDWNCHVRRSKKIHQKEETESCGLMIRRAKEENSFQFNDLYSNKSIGNGDNNISLSQNLDPSFHYQLTKNMVPFFPNNISNFTFPKIPNIENLKVAQNSSFQGQKPYINNLESGSTGTTDGDHKKVASDSRKFNNVLTNQLDGLHMR